MIHYKFIENFWGNTGWFFNWDPSISVPKRKPPSSQSQHRIYWNSSYDWLIRGFLFGTEIGGSQLKNHPVYLKK